MRVQERTDEGEKEDIEFSATRLLCSTTCRIHIRCIPFVLVVVRISAPQTLRPYIHMYKIYTYMYIQTLYIYMYSPYK